VVVDQWSPSTSRSSEELIANMIGCMSRVKVTLGLRAAWAASHTKESYLVVRFHRLATRKGKERAIVSSLIRS